MTVRRRCGGALVALGGALLLAAAIAAVAAGSGTDRPPVIGENPVGLIDPDSAALSEQFAFGRAPSAVTADAGSAWVASSLDDTRSRVDADTLQVASISGDAYASFTTPAIPPPKQCPNRSDDDGDGQVDLADPGCVNARDVDQADPPPEPPSADFTVTPASPDTEQAVTFDWTGSCPAGPCTFLWIDEGSDGNGGSSWNLGKGDSITFALTGVSMKFVELTVTDSQGRTAVSPIQPIAVTAPSELRPPTVFYVSPSGNDDGPGSLASPWRTIAASLAKLKAGGTLFARGGDYEEGVSVNVPAGTASGRITFAAYPGERPVVRGYLHLFRPDYWTVDGINVTRSDAVTDTNLVRISGGTGWAIENSEIWDARATAGLLIDDGSNDDRPVGAFAVRGSCIHDTHPTNDTSQDHNVYMDDLSGSPNADGLIERNLLFNATNGRGIKFGPGATTGGPHHIRARFNTVYNSLQNMSLSRDTHHVTLERNLLIRAAEGNIYSFGLHGSRNVARRNAGGDSPGLFGRDATSTRPVTDGGGNRSVTTGFDAASCSGFHPTGVEARRFGRYAAPRRRPPGL